MVGGGWLLPGCRCEHFRVRLRAGGRGAWHWKGRGELSWPACWASFPAEDSCVVTKPRTGQDRARHVPPARVCLQSQLCGCALVLPAAGRGSVADAASTTPVSPHVLPLPCRPPGFQLPASASCGQRAFSWTPQWPEVPRGSCPPMHPESVGASIPQLSCRAVGGRACSMLSATTSQQLSASDARGGRLPGTSPFIEACQSLPHKHPSWCFLGHLPSKSLAFDSLSQGLLLGGLKLRLPPCLILRLS